MTGTELLEALSFVDEKYIQEAENAKLRNGTPWMKVLSVVACLCILITGVYAFGRMQNKGVTESMKEGAAAPESCLQDATWAEAPAATEAATAAPEEAPAAAPKEESRTEEVSGETEGYAAAGELEQIPFVRLEIIQILEEGKFTAVVNGLDENPTAIEENMELTLVVDPSKVPGAEAEIQNDLRGIGEHSLVVVENGAYDAGSNTLYAQSLIAAAME